MSFFAFWTLFALAAVVLASGAAAVRAALGSALIGAGFLCGVMLFLAGWRMPEWVVAGFIAALAGVQLLPSATRSGSPNARRDGTAHALVSFGAGFVAAQAAVFLVDQGVPGLAAWVSAPLPAVLSVALTLRRPAFAPCRLRDEASLFLLASGLCLAAAPEVISGWNSATALNAAARAQAVTTIPGWVLAAIGAAALAGAISRWWRRN